MRLKAALAVMLLLSAALLIAVQLRSNPQPEKSADRGLEITAAPPSAARDTAAASLDGTAAVREERKEVAQPKDSEFPAWLSEEARRLDLPSVDSGRKQYEMDQIAARLTPAQRKTLLQTARSPSAPAGEKILSAYLLVQAGPSATQELRELITSAVSEPGEPHSPEEISAVRDKTLRIMALDGLAQRAQSDPSAREALAKSIPAIQDPYVKSYAEKQLARVQR